MKELKLLNLVLFIAPILLCASCRVEPAGDWKTEPIYVGYDAAAARELRGIRIQLDRLNTNIERMLDTKEQKHD